MKVLLNIVLVLIISATCLEEPNRIQFLPGVDLSMSDLTIFLRLLRMNIPFGFAHFNDGEIKAINRCQKNEFTDNGWQRCSSSLQGAMFHALTVTSKNFYIGIPCLCEFESVPFHDAIKLLNFTIASNFSCSFVKPKLLYYNKLSNNTNKVTTATVFINGNYYIARYELIKYFQYINQKRLINIHIVVGSGCNISKLPFYITTVHYTTKHHAFDYNYTTMRTLQYLNSFVQQHDIILLMCGPLGRILASEWSILRSDITILEMGSFWDEDLWGRKYENLKYPRSCMFRGDTFARPSSKKRKKKSYNIIKNLSKIS